MHAHLPTGTPLAPVAPLIIFEIICVPLNTVRVYKEKS